MVTFWVFKVRFDHHVTKCQINATTDHACMEVIVQTDGTDSFATAHRLDSQDLHVEMVSEEFSI